MWKKVQDTCFDYFMFKVLIRYEEKGLGKAHIFGFQTNLDSIFKSRDITLPTNVCPVKAMVFPVVMYGCESWTDTYFHTS